MKFYQAQNGQKTCTGILAGHDGQSLTLTLGQDTVTYPMDQVALVRLHIAF